MVSNVAIIPARGGSKRIERKNIRFFLGKPIIAYSIDAALNSGLFDEVMVSTDDDEIAVLAQKCGAEIPFIRSSENADDLSTTFDVIEEVLDCYKKIGRSFDNFCCIYPTAPFVTAQRLKEAYSALKDKQFDSVFPVVAYSYPVLRGLKLNNEKASMVWPEYMNSRSQDLEPIYHDAGQFYMSKTTPVLSKKKLWTDNTGAIVLSELEVQDIDTEVDWKLAELKFNLMMYEKE